jgi:hypothetical protein
MDTVVTEVFGHPNHHDVAGRRHHKIHEGHLEAADRIDGERRGVELMRHHVLVQVRLTDPHDNCDTERQRVRQLAFQNPEIRAEIAVKGATQVDHGGDHPQRREHHGANQ